MLLRRLLVLLALSPLACARQAPAPATASEAPLVVDHRAGEPCFSKKDPVSAVLCDAELRATDARERRDVVRLYCYDDRITEMRALAAIRGRASAKLGSRPGPAEGEKKHLRELVAVTESRIAFAWDALEACTSGYPAEVGEPQERTFFPPGTAGTDPLPPEVW